MTSIQANADNGRLQNKLQALYESGQQAGLGINANKMKTMLFESQTIGRHTKLYNLLWKI